MSRTVLGIGLLLSLAATPLVPVTISAGAPQARSGSQPAAATWPPVNPAELAMTESKVERGADAEVLLRDVRILDSTDQNGQPFTAHRYYLREKIFTDRGREERSTIRIPYGAGLVISGIGGRTIRSDGTIAVLKPADVFDRTLAQVGGFSVRQKTFVLPGVERGSIIEYQYTEAHRGVETNLPLLFQQEIPVERAVFHIRPLAVPGVVSGMKAQWYHATPAAFTRDADGYMTTSQTNLPAFHAEPYMPPAFELQPWLLIFYVTAREANVPRDPSEYWPKMAAAIYAPFKVAMAKISGDVAKAAAPIKAAKDLDAQIAAAFDIVRTVQPVATAPPALQAKYKPTQTYEDALKRGVGDPSDIRMLFAALMTSAGLDVRPAYAADRTVMFLKPESANVAFVSSPVLVVRSQDKSRFVDPGNRFAPAGELHWNQEDEPILVGGESDGGLVHVPLLGAAESGKTRKAQLRLSADGAIDGDLSGAFIGHLSMMSKQEQDSLTPADREKGLKESFTAQMPGVEVTGLTISGLDGPKEPYAYALHLHMAAYAQRTGSRIFVKPAVFQYGDPAQFTAATRTHPIYFPFPYSEHDTVTVAAPEGYEFDDASVPAPSKLADHFSYETTVTLSSNRREATFTRALVICGDKQIVYAPDEYAGIKKFFDAVTAGDGFALTLRKPAGQ